MMNMNRSFALFLSILVLCFSSVAVEARESVAELRKQRALGGIGHRYGGDNGRDHPCPQPEKNQIEQQQPVGEEAAKLEVESTPVTTTSSSLASSQAVEDDTEGLSVGAIAGIAVAGAFAMLAVVVFAMIMQRKNKPEPLAVSKVDQEEQDLENATAASDTPSSNRG